MNARTRRRLEMGARALSFSREHGDASAGYIAAVARLADRLVLADHLAQQQRSGTLQVRAATSHKRYLRQTLRRGHLAHIIRVARVAGREVPELAQKFALKRGAIPYEVFRTAARGMANEAQNHRELLVRHGMVDSVLDGLLRALDQFEAASDQGLEGRRMHVGASAKLEQVGDEVVEIVGILDALNRLRFEHDAERQAAWGTASNVIAAPRTSSASEDAPEDEGIDGGDVRPAA
jgi:hypothetical protein